MRVIQKEDVPLKQLNTQAREGTLMSRRLAIGQPGLPGNFMLTLSTQKDDYRTPRHRHNFEQIRYQLEGDFDFDRDGCLKPGMVGYFPEGTYYGPSVAADESVMLRLSFGGASGHGILTREQNHAAMAEMRKNGEFHDGIYTWFDPDGRKHNKDAYEAVWEHHNGRRLKYSEPRYEHPVMMRPESFDWVAVRPGVAKKALGAFGERGVRIGFLRLETGATAALEANTLYFALKGSGTAGGVRWTLHSTVHVEVGETGEIVATEPAELFYMGMPDLTGMPVTNAQADAVAA
jgi:hypothetical protein